MKQFGSAHFGPAAGSKPAFGPVEPRGPRLPWRQFSLLQASHSSFSRSPFAWNKRDPGSSLPIGNIKSVLVEDGKRGQERDRGVSQDLGGKKMAMKPTGNKEMTQRMLRFGAWDQRSVEATFFLFKASYFFCKLYTCAVTLCSLRATPIHRAGTRSDREKSRCA